MAAPQEPTREMFIRKVLLIEPHASRGGALESLFDARAWEVRYAPDNESALEKVKMEPFDLVVTNAATSGPEDVLLLRKLRCVRPHMRLIILTKQKTPGDVVDALRYHAFSYFTAPVPQEELRTLIDDIVNGPAWDDGIEMLHGTSQYVALAVRCDLATLDRLVQFVREGVDVPEVEKEEVAFAFREIVFNAMKYGGKFDPEKFVEICYLKSTRQITCRVKDPGDGFSFEEVLDAEKSRPLPEMDRRRESEGDLGGLGILLARHYVDELIYNENGNEVFLVKWLDRRPGP
jgi:anti-sigma regulatory factor (Ser/Thr protein kinase)